MVVAAGRRAILWTMLIGMAFGFAFAYVKLDNPAFPLDPLFKKISYFIKNGFVVLIASAVFLVNPGRRLVLGALVFMIPFTVLVNLLFADTPYLILTLVIIVVGFAVVAAPTIRRNGWRLADGPLVTVASPGIGWLGVALGLILVAVHVIYH